MKVFIYVIIEGIHICNDCRYEALEENAASNGICLGQPLVLRDDNAEEVMEIMTMKMIMMMMMTMMMKIT